MSVICDFKAPKIIKDKLWGNIMKKKNSLKLEKYNRSWVPKLLTYLNGKKI